MDMNQFIDYKAQKDIVHIEYCYDSPRRRKMYSNKQMCIYRTCEDCIFQKCNTYILDKVWQLQL